MLIRARMAFAIVAVVAWAGELVFLVANARVFGSVLGALQWTANFFTNWSGLLVATVCTACALGSSRLALPFWLALATVSTVLVGATFAVLGGWAQVHVDSLTTPAVLTNLLAHMVTPWAMLAAWLFAAPHGALRWRAVRHFALWPLAYFAQMFVRGLSGGGYPYPEVDVGRVGWAPALLFCGVVVALVVLLGAVIVALDGLIAARAGRVRRADR